MEDFSTQTQLTQEISDFKSTRDRRPIYAMLFGAAILGGIGYFLFGIQPPQVGPKEVQAEQTAPIAAPAVAVAKPVEAAPVKVPAPKVFFTYREFRINTAMASELDVWADRMKSDQQMTLQVDGHCDERGSNAFNLKLGQKRANATKAYLVSKGISSQRLRTTSYGRSRPATVGHDEFAWKQNRRVELHPDTMALTQR